MLKESDAENQIEKIRDAFLVQGIGIPRIVFIPPEPIEIKTKKKKEKPKMEDDGEDNGESENEDEILVLTDWQKWLLRSVLERYPDDHPEPSKAGRLRYKQVVISMPRKNGKSLLGALLAL